MKKGAVLLPIVQLLMAGMMQAQQTLDYGTSLRDGMAKENERFAKVKNEIGKKRIDANEDFIKETSKCSGAGDVPAARYKQCVEEARKKYALRLRELDAEDTDALAQHKMNIKVLRNKWLYWQPWVRPDCVGNIPVLGGCHGAVCH
jgi:hypothetical protein